VCCMVVRCVGVLVVAFWLLEVLRIEFSVRFLFCSALVLRPWGILLMYEQAD